MNRLKSIKSALTIFLFFSLVLVGMYFFSKGNSNNVPNEEEVPDSVKFSKEYPGVGENNVFEYKTIEEIIKIFESGTGVVYLGFPECPWCQRYVIYLNEVANDVGLKNIYYFNILQDRKDNTEGYRTLLSLLDGYLLNDDDGNPRIFVPDISVVVNGEIVGHDNETSMESGSVDEYWTEQKVENFKNKLKGILEKVVNNCKTCNI
ncbi:MAG TPA: hypothetical protein PLG47_01160 [Candidatus Dojkabacteria bacterium]|nr:hypothetical protein [Candidatus Dojkabacteria bacterium]